MIPVTICLSVVYWFNISHSDHEFYSSIYPSSIPTLEAIAGHWLGNVILDDDQIEIYRRGRFGTSLFVISLYLLSLASSLIIPKIDEDRSNSTETELNSAWNPIGSKRAHFCWCTICIEILLVHFYLHTLQSRQPRQSIAR